MHTHICLVHALYLCNFDSKFAAKSEWICTPKSPSKRCIHMPLAHMVTNHVNHVVLMHDVLSPGITTYKDIPSTSTACQVSTNVKMYVKSDNFPTDSTSICNISLKSNPNAKLFER